MLVVSEEAFTDSSAKTGIAFYTTAAGSTSVSERMRLDGAGHLGIGTSTPNAYAILDLTSTTAALILPRMTTTQRDAMTAVSGMLIYNTTTGKLNVRGASAWEVVTSA